MITVDQLSKTFISRRSPPGWLGWTKPRIETRFEAIKQLTFSIDPGEFVALLGPNGAGKTTTLKMLSGILYPTSGYIDIFGHQPFQKTTAFKKMMSFVMAQKSQIFLEIPIKDTFDFIAEVYGLEPSVYHKRLSDLVDRFHLGDKLETIGRRLSLGQRMKCELVCSFLYAPAVIFLDEPTIGLDVNSVQEVRQFLRQMNQDHQVTMILTTHNMQDVEELCPRTLLINHGHKEFDGPTPSLKRTFGDQQEIEFIFDPDGAKPHKLETLHQQLEDFSAQVIEHSPGTLRVVCNRSDSTQIINLVILQNSVAEINIHEQDLAAIMGKLYQQPSHHD
jgi:ABC-2 type transport system ATP-binding protein